ncbi:MAG: glycyl-radical enzyme activating protein [Lachnospiraceae bacterium]|nr:glycyl-radical enzyme activating protein [Lachnospiraceae bacterium]MBR4767426.1 glycyl-radical enzyme activating protein [Lachnospiraceae bacterium]
MEGGRTARIFAVKHFAVHDGDGIRTTVFFKGCPLRCVWCHNPEGYSPDQELAWFSRKCASCGSCVNSCPAGVLSLREKILRIDRGKCVFCGQCEEVCPNNALKIYGKEVTVEELLPELTEDLAFYENSGGGVTLSGGECLLNADFAADLLKRLKERGIHTAVDTCGYVPKESIGKVIPFTDVFLYDVKAFHSDVHVRCTGRPNGLILDNLRYLDRCGAKIEIRIPLIPGWNDGEIEAIGSFLKTLRNVTKTTVLPYHSFAGSKFESLGKENSLPERMPETAEVEKAKEVLRSFGLSVK